MKKRSKQRSGQRDMAIMPLESRTMMSADLSISSITMSPQFLATNEGTQATITVRNNGNATAPAGVSVKVVFSRDKKFGNDDDRLLPTYKTTKALAPGKSTTIQVNSRATAQQPGDFRIAAFIDSRNIVGESNEKNNVGLTTGVVRYYNDLEDHTVTATAKKDRISIWKANGRALVDVNGTLYGIQGVWLYKPVTINALAGHDRIAAAPDYPYKLIVNGGKGNDTIVGGAGNDTLNGQGHADRIYGGAGNDALNGGTQNDFLLGEAGNDSLRGEAGDDDLTGGEGTNNLSGGADDDTLHSSGNSADDIVSGGAGNDTADSDATDVVDQVETR